MKILISISAALLGGHILSAFTIARYLQKAGHEIIFAGASNKMTPTIQAMFPFYQVDVPLYHGERQTYFTWKSLQAVAQLRNIIKNEGVDLVHAFDARVYILSMIAGLQERKPVTCTLCGGTDPQYNLPLTRQICVFSDEQKQKMVDRFKWPPQRVEVIRNRVEIGSDLTDHPEYEDFFATVQLDADVPTIMMISSFDGTKSSSVLHVFDAFESLVNEGVGAQMVFIGGEGNFFKKMVERGESLNRIARKRVVAFTGPVFDAYKLLKNASIVIGVGRSAFEGMIFKKPTIIVGANGYSGLVTEETIPDLGYYNFSGRNQKQLVQPGKLTDVVKQLLADPELCEVSGRVGKDFILQEIDVAKGISRIEKMYRDNLKQPDAWFRAMQWLSVAKIMVPIWRDNWWHTLGMPIKRMLGLVK